MPLATQLTSADSCEPSCPPTTPLRNIHPEVERRQAAQNWKCLHCQRSRFKCTAAVFSAAAFTSSTFKVQRRVGQLILVALLRRAINSIADTCSEGPAIFCVFLRDHA